jgi:RsiW-degrading membrane proteinase PrsW (M82 family)
MEYITALVFPFFLLLIEKFLPYPYIIEELFKFFLAKKSDTTKTAIILGVLFSFSEAIFYVFNPSYSIISNPISLTVRFLIVTPMHITTILIMYYFSKVTKTRNNKNIWPIGIILAILIHYIFNLQSF